MPKDNHWLEMVNKLRRRMEQVTDYLAIRTFYKPCGVEHYDGDPRIAIVIVNFNTVHYLKLLLITLSESLYEYRRLIKQIVIVDNASRDGSKDFLNQFESVQGISIVNNGKGLNHANGLRIGIRHIDETEKDIPKSGKSNYYLTIDSDVIIIRNDLWADIQEVIYQRSPDLLGEIQHDVGFPYVHPSFMLIKKWAYHREGIIPFINNGAPALYLQQSLRARRAEIVDFPVRKDGYIVHRGRGAIQGVQRYRRFHSYATVSGQEHFHGNNQGGIIWDAVEKKHAEIIGEPDGKKCAQYIASQWSSCAHRQSLNDK
jgi:glycosyltransferase involved in cell wall biosynthesis